ncbi:MAG: methyltransferase domain-containing protein [Clostridiales bacterium]|nr:methyltransferase domain-containing protein [Clostridiales bacterium]
MFNRAEMLNKRAGKPEFKVNEVIKSLNIEKGSIVVDIGSGGGFYSMHFAAETGLNGSVYAVDMNKKYLNYIECQAEKSGLTNMKTILVDGELSGLPENSCDLIFLRNSYHHILKPDDYFLKLKRFLKINGRVVIIDYKKTTKITLINLIGHYVKQKDIINCMNKCGYKHLNSFDFIKKQSFNIFKI